MVILINPPNNEFDVPNNYIIFKWNAVPGADAYHFIASKGNVFSDFSLDIDILTTDTFFIAKELGLELFENYRWMVKAYTNENTCTEYAGPYTFKTGESIAIPSGIDENEDIQFINIYPNPVSSGSELNFHLKATKPFSSVAQIFDINGKVVQAVEINVHHGDNFLPMDVSGLSSGIYTLNVNSDQGNHSEKFVILGSVR